MSRWKIQQRKVYQIKFDKGNRNEKVNREN